MKNTSLRKSLTGNATFSLISGLLLIFGSRTLGPILGLPDGYWLTWVGFGLLLFVGFIGIVLRIGMPRFWVNTIIIQDIIWVVASLFVLIVNPWSISNTGLFLIAAVAFIVGVFAVLQFKYSRTGIVKN